MYVFVYRAYTNAMLRYATTLISVIACGFRNWHSRATMNRPIVSDIDREPMNAM